MDYENYNKELKESNVKGEDANQSVEETSGRESKVKTIKKLSKRQICVIAAVLVIAILVIVLVCTKEPRLETQIVDIWISGDYGVDGFVHFYDEGYMVYGDDSCASLWQYQVLDDQTLRLKPLKQYSFDEEYDWDGSQTEFIDIKKVIKEIEEITPERIQKYGHDFSAEYYDTFGDNGFMLMWKEGTDTPEDDSWWRANETYINLPGFDNDPYWHWTVFEN